MNQKSNIKLNNPFDPSGMGMYSKTGMFTSSLYSVFRKKDEIIRNNPKYLKVSAFPSFDIDLMNILNAKKEISDSSDDEEDGNDQQNKKVDLRQVADDKFFEWKRNKRKLEKSKGTFKNQVGRYKHFCYRMSENVAPPPTLYNPRKMRR